MGGVCGVSRVGCNFLRGEGADFEPYYLDKVSTATTATTSSTTTLSTSWVRGTGGDPRYVRAMEQVQRVFMAADGLQEEGRRASREPVQVFMAVDVVREVETTSRSSAAGVFKTIKFMMCMAAISLVVISGGMVNGTSTSRTTEGTRSKSGGSPIAGNVEASKTAAISGSISRRSWIAEAVEKKGWSSNQGVPQKGKAKAKAKGKGRKEREKEGTTTTRTRGKGKEPT